jgi:hypothetical protein
VEAVSVRKNVQANVMDECYRKIIDHCNSLPTEAQKRAFFATLERKFGSRYERELKAALTAPVPDLSKIRELKEVLSGKVWVTGTVLFGHIEPEKLAAVR